jgi:ComF family protein
LIDYLTRSLVRGLDWFLPPLCLGCRSTPGQGIDRLSLCPRCRQGLRPVSDRRCATCLVRLADPSAPRGWRCAACRRRPPAWDRLLVGWLYEPPLREVVVGLKFGRLEYLGAAIGRELAARFGSELAACEAVVPMPLHWWRAWRRGYNQAELLARAVADAVERPLVRRLRRRRPTRPQTGLDRATRQRNLAGAFCWRGAPATAHGHWLLVDDVLTTGATLESAARALRAAGASRITALLAAATPHPSAAERRTIGE